MDNKVFFPLLIVMVLVTYLIRALPFVLFRKKIENEHIKAFFDYIPYTVLTAMTKKRAEILHPRVLKIRGKVV